MAKTRHTIFEFPVFCHYIFHVEITSDIVKSLKKYPSCEKVEIDPDGNTGALTVHVLDDSFSFIFLQPNASVGTIAHESWHGVMRMMEYVGVDVDHETVAYHLGFLVDKIFGFLRKRKKS